MNETIKTILSRRSVRNYSGEQIKKEELDLIVKAGLNAPSACNQQSWHFTVIQNKELISDLDRAAKEALAKSEQSSLKELAADESYNILYNAPTVIVVSGEKSALAPRVDCAAATENMLLAAESLNIGTCWIGLVYPLFVSENAKDWQKRLNIPETHELYHAVTMGYKTEDNMQAAPRREGTVNYM